MNDPFANAYRERLFSLTNEWDYMRRQACSCLYLRRELSRWAEYGPRVDSALRALLCHLIGVHQCQHWRLVCRLGVTSSHIVIAEPEKSFYFDSMYDAVKSAHIPRIAVHAMSYERGARRYCTLMRARETVWNTLLQEAQDNRDRCVAYMVERYGDDQAEQWLHGTVWAEQQVMRKIDERKGQA